jgi:hypothetical protein
VEAVRVYVILVFEGGVVHVFGTIAKTSGFWLVSLFTDY